MRRVRIIQLIREAVKAGHRDEEAVLEYVLNNAGEVDIAKWIEIIMKLIELLLPLFIKSN